MERNLKLYTNSRRYLSLNLIMILLISIFMACSQKVSFSENSMVPGARGSVKVKKDNNNNYGISVDVINLAEPKLLPNPKDVYVVWMETGEKDTRKLGQLKVSSSLLSKTIKGSLYTISPHKPARVFITAEDNLTVEYPGNYVVLNTKKFR
jgi:hypothetical protein